MLLSVDSIFNKDLAWSSFIWTLSLKTRAFLKYALWLLMVSEFIWKIKYIIYVSLCLEVSSWRGLFFLNLSLVKILAHNYWQVTFCNSHQKTSDPAPALLSTIHVKISLFLHIPQSLNECISNRFPIHLIYSYRYWKSNMCWDIIDITSILQMHQRPTKISWLFHRTVRVGRSFCFQIPFPQSYATFLWFWGSAEPVILLTLCKAKFLVSQMTNTFPYSAFFWKALN